MAELSAKVSGGRATAEWVPKEGAGTGKEAGLDFAGYDVEVSCGTALKRSPDPIDFRVFAKRKEK